MKVIVEIEVLKDLRGMSYDEILEFIKKHMGYYSDHDIAKLVKVITVEGR